MNRGIKDVLKFVFPEYYIIGVVKKHGFIAKSISKYDDKEVKKNDFNGVGYERAEHKVGNNMKSSVDTYETVDRNDSNRNKENINARLYNNTAYSYGKGSLGNTNGSILDEKINLVRVGLSNSFIGQSKYLDGLCTAFKRGFIIGADSIKPRNTFFVIGNKGHGKSSSIETAIKLMREQNLVREERTLCIDLAIYDESDEKDDFLSHLYSGITGNFDVIVFNNFHRCHRNVLDVLIQLVIKGEYDLEARYAYLNGKLVESPGHLLEESIGKISANGKFFVFCTEKSENDIINYFGNKFMEAIGDIIYVNKFSKSELEKIADLRMRNYRTKCNNNLNIRIRYTDKVVELIASNFKEKRGINSLDEYIERNIYKLLAECKLQGKISSSNQMVDLVLRNEEIIVKIGFEEFDIKQFERKKYESAGLEEVKKELENVIGLKSVKQYIESIEENLAIQKKREESGYKVAEISMHMIFTGNPGTGKTTIARIVAKYLKALGVLSNGQLVEVTRADLVAQYVGHTAKLTNSVVKSALGGVLFIDEAYALCRDEQDTFGLEAIDALVKGIEDNRNNLVVILAGYREEMNEFLKTNSGLKSRFPNIIDFEDYTSEEMYKISNITAKSKGYVIDEQCEAPLIELYNKKQIKGKNDSGNGRLVRNIVEKAILNQSKRLLKDKDGDMSKLIFEDFKFENNESFDLEKSLSSIVGLEEVKEFIRTQYRLLIAQEKRKKAGLSVDTTQALNMIFSGNPGTGKTTVARVIGKMFKEMGVLKAGQLIETDRGGLVAEYVGQTAKKTEEIFKSALGGVLFIDEAYSLSSDGSSFGREAIDTLVKLIEDYRGEIVIILAGYKKEMLDFLKVNSGLQSRFPLTVDFQDYTSDELYEIGLRMVEATGLNLDNDAMPVFKNKIDLLKKNSNEHSGNGRMVRNYIEEIMRNQSSRIAIDEVAAQDMSVIITEDIECVKKEVLSFDLEKQLSNIIGIDEVKDFIRSLNARLKLQNERKKLGLKVDTSQTMHMIFKGNPGTGKTTIARLIAKTLYNIGVIKTDKLIETDRAGLVAGYVGQTAIKTTEKFMDAMDGVLFVDEAYSLSQGGANDFGKEAIDTLVKLMDDYRERTIVILAGYSEDMDKFLMVNSGLKSRFPNIIEFKDYDANQLISIAEIMFKDKGYELTKDAKAKMSYIFNEVRCDSQFGNGRYVRNLLERALNNQAMRLSSKTTFVTEDLITIIDEDIERV